MKYYKPLIILNVAAILFSIVTIVGLHYASHVFKDINRKVDYGSIIKKAENSNDIKWLKKGMLMSLEQRQAAHADIAESYISFADFIPAFILFYMSNIYLTLKLRNIYSNNLSNLTGAKNAPPS